MNIDDNITLDQAVPSKSKYLSKDDVDPAILATVSHMSIEEIEGDHGMETKTVLHLDGDYKPLILNQTNKELLKVCTGATTVGGVKGKQIVLYNDPAITYAGKLTGGIRIRKPIVKQPEPAFDDSIPF